MESQNRPLWIIGVMSGTSVDSIDAVLCEISEQTGGPLHGQVLAFHEHPIPAELRTRIFESFSDGTRSLSLACSLNFEIGNAFADAVLALISKSDVQASSIDAIASHGQTLYHIAPHMAVATAGKIASTLQVGEPAVIAEKTGVRVIADFRVADMAAGGNGAPLVPFADYHLFSAPGRGVVVQNIGGIANCTYLPPDGDLDKVIAFDTGPGNMVIDGLVQQFYPGENFDRDGAHAAAGQVLEDVMADWMTIPYIAAPPPKSTGRELFGVQFAARARAKFYKAAGDDLIATATEFAAKTIAENIKNHVAARGAVHEVLLAGGGALNPVLVSRIREAMKAACPEATVRLLDETGFSSKARECIAFALLGYARLKNIPGNVPSATGARHPAILGKISEPPPS